MFPDLASKPRIDYDLLTPGHVLFDLVYNPEITAFLNAGKERGCKIIPGLKMLYSQAEKSWEIWNDDKLP
jgi:shikimate dehydrogenase